MADRVGEMFACQPAPAPGDPRIQWIQDRQRTALIVAVVFAVTGLCFIAGPFALCQAVDIRRESKALGRSPTPMADGLYWIGVGYTVVTALTALLFMVTLFGPLTFAGLFVLLR